MLQARIVSKRGSLYFAAEATPYDLENLRTHIREFQTSKAKDVRLELSFDRMKDGAMDLHVSAWARRLASEGVQVSFLPTLEGRGATLRSATR